MAASNGNQSVGQHHNMHGNEAKCGISLSLCLPGPGLKRDFPCSSVTNYRDLSDYSASKQDKPTDP